MSTGASDDSLHRRKRENSTLLSGASFVSSRMLLLGDCGYTENDAGFIRLVPRLTPIPKPIISDLTNNGFVDFEDLTVLLA
ncbi:MAG: hypothetical protein IID44_04585, partial [Planctomycetes bacterium]|nr:hypothetical protein [Planctomycetota bacterium]